MFALSEVQEASAETIKLRADYWCPYNCSPGEARPGYMIELAIAALSPMGHTIEYDLLPWDRALSEAGHGVIDAVVGATPLEAEGLVFTRPLGMDSDCFFVRTDSDWHYKDIASLDKVLLGVVSGYTHDEGPIDAYIDTHQAKGGSVIAARSDQGAEKNIQLLFNRRIDAILDSGAVIRFISNRMGRGSELKEAGCLKPLSLHIAFSPKHPDAAGLASAIDKTVEAMRADGSLAILLASYGLEDWQP